MVTHHVAWANISITCCPAKNHSLGGALFGLIVPTEQPIIAMVSAGHSAARRLDHGRGASLINSPPDWHLMFGSHLKDSLRRGFHYLLAALG